MLFFPVAAAPVVAGSGPLAPIVGGVLSAAGLLYKLFGRKPSNPVAQTPTNPVTGQPVPIDPSTGSVYGIDTYTGLPSELTNQIWGLSNPSGLNISGMGADQFLQRGLPFWATNRLVGISDQLGGWDKLVSWLYDKANWATLMTLMTQPWGQSSVDQLPEGFEPSEPTQQPNEGQTTEYPEGQDPTVGADGEPTFSTDTTGALPPGTGVLGAGLAGALAAAGLGGLLGGGGGSQGGTPATGTPTFTVDAWGMPDAGPLPISMPTSPFLNLPNQDLTNPAIRNGTPVFSTDVYGNIINANPPTPGFSVTGTGNMPTIPPIQIPIGGTPTTTLPPLPTVPSPIPGTLPPAAPPAGGAPGTPSLGSLLSGGGGGGGAAMPPGYPSLPPHPALASIFGVRPKGPPVPGLNQIMGGFRA